LDILLEKRKRTEEQSEARKEKTADEVREALLNEGIARQCPIGMRSGRQARETDPPLAYWFNLNSAPLPNFCCWLLLKLINITPL
jgi:hypothetical protein